MAAQVFISHSCKDRELSPPTNLSAEALAVRAKRLEFVRNLREQLFKKLKASKKFTVYLDVRGSVKAGDVWRSGLHKALRKCSAGIVLITPESIESGWVLKEATILSWRVFLDEPVVLVPIVIDVTPAELERHGFGALNLDAIQWIELANSTKAESDRAVREALEVLNERIAAPLSDTEPQTPTEDWIGYFADLLFDLVDTRQEKRRNQRLRAMCDQLEIPAKDRDRFDGDPCVHIASHVLVADIDRLIGFIGVTSASNDQQRKSLRKWLASLWVDATPASRLLKPTKQVIAIDATEIAPMREYLTRAFCNQEKTNRIVETTPNTDGTDEPVMAEIRSRLTGLFPIENKAALLKDIEKHGPIYVLLGPGSTRESILDKVTHEFSGVTFIVAAGPQPEEKLGQKWYREALTLRPLLQGEGRELAGTRYRNQLNLFAQG